MMRRVDVAQGSLSLTDPDIECITNVILKVSDFTSENTTVILPETSVTQFVNRILISCCATLY